MMPRKPTKRAWDEGDEEPTKPTTRLYGRKRAKAEPNLPKEEKRKRRFRPNPPQSFHEIYNRAMTQRFYVISRHRDDSVPQERVELAGSTGNVYTITISHCPSCNCPHALKGNQCKHILYVMSRVLHAKFEHVYQLALLTDELHEIFRQAPIPAKDASSPEKNVDKRRKPVEGDCPICFTELDAKSSESVVWCRAACGQNMHKSCFKMWARVKKQAVTCPFCRSPWQEDEETAKTILKEGKVTAEGYVNVADQLGISTVQVADTSTYSRWWSGHYGRRGYW
ncbi:hypothetical protein SODALDRAFT_308631 [Sodiomyces alkalinus F11]|uniref:RING finger domain-containing protein n=1 Tax=Sodiomyces alkalinus (strain CBS 110278 / VKM F-3762 / F11) TaxID=1314773 RepID=A0A3N2Q4J5_SODAK|nr:hypothetical protein SODALDRAFT_308631 [Sodiomyces alkalinus F11]ROT41689.1 hypothetical protein SODALDRAFT_308631 [Sodiomyces alkalinus F11]